MKFLDVHVVVSRATGIHPDTSCYLAWWNTIFTTSKVFTMKKETLTQIHWSNILQINAFVVNIIFRCNLYLRYIFGSKTHHYLVIRPSSYYKVCSSSFLSSSLFSKQRNYTHTYIYIHSYMHIRIFIYVYIYIDTYIYSCIFLLIFTYAHIYT